MAQRHIRKSTRTNKPEVQETPQDEVEVLEEVQYVIEEEYTQLKRKNGRRLVAAGALALVAGGLFAAASTTGSQPKLVTPNPEATRPKTEILHPTAASIPVVAYPMDDELNAASEVAIVRTNKKGETVALTEAERKAEEAKLAREKAQRVAQLRKQQAERAELERARQAAMANANPSSNTATASAKPKAPEKPQKTAAELAEERRKAREEQQRQRRAQQLSAQAERERAAQEAAAAEKVRQAQLAADKERAAARAKLAANQSGNSANTGNTATAKSANSNNSGSLTPQNVKTPAQSTADKVQQEKQRAQRVAAERERRQLAIQAGSFTDKAQAQKMQQQLKSMNYQTGIEEVKTEKGTVYRVKTGRFHSKEAADNALKNMKDKGVKGIIVGQ